MPYITSHHVQFHELDGEADDQIESEFDPDYLEKMFRKTESQKNLLTNYIYTLQSEDSAKKAKKLTAYQRR